MRRNRPAVSRESTSRTYRNDRDWSRNRSNPRERLRETNSKDRSWNDRNRDNRKRANRELVNRDKRKKEIIFDIELRYTIHEK